MSPGVLVVAALLAWGAPPAALAPDSTDLLHEARDAQRRFEQLRRRYLPRADDLGGGPCDDRVGRMCWRQDPGRLWIPEPEDPRVGEARALLLARLAELGRRLPGDAWILGQRVRYLLEARRRDDALALAAGACALAEPWRCHALAGLVLHDAGRYEAADTAFGAALAAMPPEQARRWIDPAPVLDGDGRHLLDDAAEAGDAAWRAAAEGVWALADPLLLVPGNDRRTAHLARHVAVLVREDAANPHDLSWGDDLATLLVRYGPEVGWEKAPPRPGAFAGSGGVTGHEAPDSRRFLPPGDALRDPGASPADAWVADLAYAPSAYAPAAAPVLLPMASTVSVLPRGDRAVVVATVRLPADTTAATRRGRRPPFAPLPAFAVRPPLSGLFALAPDGTVEAEARRAGTAAGALALELPAGRHLLSVEAWDPAAGRAGRFRRGLVVPALPPDVAALSDLLLLAPGAEPTTLEEALPRVLPDATLRPGDSVVVAWETTGLGWRPEELRYALSLEDADGGLLRRAGEWLGLVDPERPLALAWSEDGPDAPGPVFRSVTLGLPELAPGTWTLRLELATAGRDVLVVRRTLRIEDGAPGPRPPGGPPPLRPHPATSPGRPPAPPASPRR